MRKKLNDKKLNESSSLSLFYLNSKIESPILINDTSSSSSTSFPNNNNNIANNNKRAANHQIDSNNNKGVKTKKIKKRNLNIDSLIEFGKRNNETLIEQIKMAQKANLATESYVAEYLRAKQQTKQLNNNDQHKKGSHRNIQYSNIN